MSLWFEVNGCGVYHRAIADNVGTLFHSFALGTIPTQCGKVSSNGGGSGRQIHTRESPPKAKRCPTCDQGEVGS